MFRPAPLLERLASPCRQLAPPARPPVYGRACPSRGLSQPGSAMTTRPNHPLPRQDLHLQACQRPKVAHRNLPFSPPPVFNAARVRKNWLSSSPSMPRYWRGWGRMSTGNSRVFWATRGAGFKAGHRWTRPTLSEHGWPLRCRPAWLSTPASSWSPAAAARRYELSADHSYPWESPTLLTADPPVATWAVSSAPANEAESCSMGSSAAAAPDYRA